MTCSWKTSKLTDEQETFHVLAELKGKRWLCRGQPKQFDNLRPKTDRAELQGISRFDKLTLERRAIDTFRYSARYFASPGEHEALSSDIGALMVLRHYGVPTRLLDWSLSPYVAAFFAAEKFDDKDGELWAFDHDIYAREGRKQWEKWPQTTTDGNPDNFKAELTAFTIDEPPDWFCCAFYPKGFPRQNAQNGLYSMTACSDRDHALSIKELLKAQSAQHRWIISADLKAILRRRLQVNHGIWCGALYPDTAGAADTAHAVYLNASTSRHSCMPEC